MKRACALVTIAAVLALTGCGRFAKQAPGASQPPAVAQESFGGATASVRAGALPAGKMSVHPLMRSPANIRYTEQLMPLHFVAHSEMQHLTALQDPEFEEGRRAWNDPPYRSPYCLTSSQEPATGESFGTGEWSGASELVLPVNSTEAVHFESIADGDKPTFTIMDAWADASVRGVRPILRRTIPVKRLVEAHGVGVFAFRDVRDDGRQLIQVVVTRPPVRRGSIIGSPFVMALANGESSETRCPHARVALPITVGDSTMSSIDIGVEVAAETFQMPSGTLTPSRARRLRVNLSAVWLQRDRDATIDARLVWMGDEQAHVEMRGMSTRQPSVGMRMRADSE